MNSSLRCGARLERAITIRIAKRAAAEIQQLDIWWAQNRPSAPGAVEEELRRAFALLVAEPKVGAVAANASVAGVRRVLLSRIHHYLYYRVVAKQITILALWHTGRGTAPGI
jgi:plasmid stabilization system protein ParE